MNGVRIQHRNSNASEGDGSVDSASCTLVGLEGIMKLEVDHKIVSYFSSTSNILRIYGISWNICRRCPWNIRSWRAHWDAGLECTVARPASIHRVPQLLSGRRVAQIKASNTEAGALGSAWLKGRAAEVHQDLLWQRACAIVEAGDSGVFGSWPPRQLSTGKTIMGSGGMCGRGRRRIEEHGRMQGCLCWSLGEIT
jgi:hypothetical protein